LIAERAEASGLSVAGLACPELEPLVDALLRTSSNSLLSEPRLHRFFSLEPALRCGSLPALLASRGVPIADLEALAKPTRGGWWELRQGVGVLPRLAWHEGRLVRVNPVEDSRRRLFSTEPVSDLLAVVAASGPTSP